MWLKYISNLSQFGIIILLYALNMQCKQLQDGDDL